jgi:hypothetical protein
MDVGKLRGLAPVGLPNGWVATGSMGPLYRLYIGRTWRPAIGVVRRVMLMISSISASYPRSFRWRPCCCARCGRTVADAE